MKAALYLRVSSKKQAEKWSLPSQRKILTAHAIKHGWTPTIYDEGGVSGETLKARPVIRRLLADAAAGRIQVVLVIETERLCRASDLTDWATITTTFRKAGVLVATPERTFNLAAAEDDFESDLRGILSKREKRKILERVRRGQSEAKDAGRWIGGKTPLGYRYNREAKNLELDPETASLVRRIFRSPLNPWALSRKLQGEGVSLSHLAIARMRRNPVYLGRRKGADGELVPATWKPLIDPATWLRAQTAKQAGGHRPPRGYLLAGLLRCSTCGRLLSSSANGERTHGRRLRYYRCKMYPHRSKCPKPASGPAWLLEAVAVDALTRYVTDPKFLAQGYREMADALRERGSPDSRADLIAQERDVADRQRRLLEAVEAGAVPLATARARTVELERERIRLEGVLAEPAGGEATLPPFHTFRTLAKSIPKAKPSTVRAILVSFLDRGELSPRPKRRLRLEWKLGGESLTEVPHIHSGPGKGPRERLEALRSMLPKLRLREPKGGVR